MSMRDYLEKGRDLAERVPYSAIALASRFAVADVFWRSGRTKVNGFSIREETFYLFREEYKVPLLSPSQAFFLREALRLRLISARVSLLAHEEGSFKADTRQCAQWLQQYFNSRDRKVTQALAALRQISAAEINIEIPDISASLDAVRNAKLVRERGLR